MPGQFPLPLVQGDGERSEGGPGAAGHTAGSHCTLEHAISVPGSRGAVCWEAGSEMTSLG